MNASQLFILGKGDIARHLARIGQAADYPVSVCEPELDADQWPKDVLRLDKRYTDQPWPLPPHTHAVIARGHDDDAASVAALLNQGAQQVYLISSARRAQSVLQEAQPLLSDPQALERLSAPAGLALGGDSSAEIALSILAEIQWRNAGGPLRPLSELRDGKAAAQTSTRDDDACPGKRP